MGKLTENEKLEFEYAYLLHQYEMCDEILENVSKSYAKLGRKIFELAYDICTYEEFEEKMRKYGEEIIDYVEYYRAIRVEQKETLAKIESSYNLLPRESRLVLAQRNNI